MESGNAEPSLSQLQSIANYYKVDLSELITLDLKNNSMQIVELKDLKQKYSNQIKDFVNFVDAFKQKIGSGIDDYELAQSLNEFHDTKFMLFITNLKHTFTNKNSEGLLAPSNVNSKFRAGLTWESQEDLHLFVNSLFFDKNFDYFFTKKVKHVLSVGKREFYQLQTIVKGGKSNAMCLGVVLEVNQ